jgi:maleate isomerase
MDARPQTLQQIVDGLHEAVGASRTTIRAETPGEVFPVVAERVSPGVPSLVGESSIDLRAAKTFRFLEREQRPLIQDDLSNHPLAPPPELIRRYGVRAQMLAPVVRDGRMVAFVSVHYVPSARRWSPRDVALVADAAREVERLLPGA